MSEYDITPALCFADTYMNLIKEGIPEEEARGLARAAGTPALLQQAAADGRIITTRVISLDGVSCLDITGAVDAMQLEGDSVIGDLEEIDGLN